MVARLQLNWGVWAPHCDEGPSRPKGKAIAKSQNGCGNGPVDEEQSLDASCHPAEPPSSDFEVVATWTRVWLSQWPWLLCPVVNIASYLPSPRPEALSGDCHTIDFRAAVEFFVQSPIALRSLTSTLRPRCSK